MTSRIEFLYKYHNIEKELNWYRNTNFSYKGLDKNEDISENI